MDVKVANTKVFFWPKKEEGQVVIVEMSVIFSRVSVVGVAVVELVS